jgi:two-component sensor histidine kinase
MTIRTFKDASMESKLRAAYSELAAIYANAPVVLFVVNEQLRVEKVNDLAVQFAGREVASLIGEGPGDALGCLNAGGDPHDCGKAPSCGKCTIRQVVMHSLAEGAPHKGVEVWLPIAGHDDNRCLLVSTSVMALDQTRKVLVCAQDITDSKRTQLALEAALAEKTILLQEIHHRVKNNLAVISSLLSMKADGATNAEARRVLEESQQRVYSMALIHEHLYGNGHLGRINFAEYARHLVRRLHTACAGDPDRIAIELNLDPIELEIERAVPCGLILNELLTNAFKYAFRDRLDGRIAVSFHESTTGTLQLTVEDDGVGLPAGGLDRRNQDSLGLRIVQLLTRQLDGKLTEEPSAGTRIVLEFRGKAKQSPN